MSDLSEAVEMATLDKEMAEEKVRIHPSENEHTEGAVRLHFL